MAAAGLLFIIAQWEWAGLLLGPLLLVDILGWRAWVLAAVLGTGMAMLPIKRTEWSVVIFIFAAAGWCYCTMVAISFYSRFRF
jgi:hypothetical protein